MTDKPKPTEENKDEEEGKSPKIRDLTPGKDPAGGSRTPKYPKG